MNNKTYNYSKFHWLNGNREVSESHVRELVKKIGKEGWFENPIIVNEKFEIIDGQHRFEACHRLNLPIEYKVIEGENLTTAIQRNQSTKAWSARDYVFAWAAEGNPDFVKVVDAYNRYPKLPSSIILSVFGLASGIKNLGRQGEIWKYQNAGEEFYLSELDFYARNFSCRSNFLRVMLWVLQHCGIDADRMHEQMCKYGHTKDFVRTAKSTPFQLESIYNYHYAEKK